ncbi:GrpB family protein [Nocardia vinacea]|uniref:GrpB family protein n=1 Tax=Nocardia vinacea TaxID=96468 RepID=UPI0035709917
MKVGLVDHDPQWSARFIGQRDRVSMVLARWLAEPVEHTGSTAVPGLRSKPVVDMLAPVASLAERDGDGTVYGRLVVLAPVPARGQTVVVIAAPSGTSDSSSACRRARAPAGAGATHPSGTLCDRTRHWRRNMSSSRRV